MTATSIRMSPEQFLALRDNKGFELTSGRVVERRSSVEASQIALNVAMLLRAHRPTVDLGRLTLADVPFQCFPDQETIRKPDVAFVSYQKWPRNRRVGECFRVEPCLAVEVLCETDTFWEISRRIKDYCRAGVKEIWVVNPFMRHVFVQPLGAKPYFVSKAEELNCEEILPGFRCQVNEIFEHVPTEE